MKGIVKMLVFRLFLPALLLFACGSEPRTNVRTYEGDRVYVRGDGQVKIATRDADGVPLTVLVDEPRWPRADALVRFYDDALPLHPVRVVMRVTIDAPNPARTEIDIHHHPNRITILRERVIGGDHGLTLYE